MWGGTAGTFKRVSCRPHGQAVGGLWACHSAWQQEQRRTGEEEAGTACQDTLYLAVRTCLQCTGSLLAGQSSSLTYSAEVVAGAATSLPEQPGCVRSLTCCGLCRDKLDMYAVRPTPAAVVCHGDQAGCSCAASSSRTKLIMELLAALRTGKAFRHVVGGPAVSGTLCQGHDLLHWYWLQPSWTLTLPLHSAGSCHTPDKAVLGSQSFS